MNTDEKLVKLRQHLNRYPNSVLSFLDTDGLKKIAEIAELKKKVKKGLITDDGIRTDEIDPDDVIIDYQDPTADMFIILEGQAIAYGGGELFEDPESVTLKRAAFDTFNPGDVCGEFKFMDREKMSRSANVAIISDEIEYLKIKERFEKDFFMILCGNKGMCRYFFDLFINKTRKLTEEMNELKFLKAAEKLKRFFEDKRDCQSPAKTFSYKVKKIDKQTIADEICVHKRTVQRLMIPLEKAGYMKIEGEWIHVLKEFPQFDEWRVLRRNHKL